MGSSVSGNVSVTNTASAPRQPPVGVFPRPFRAVYERHFPEPLPVQTTVGAGFVTVRMRWSAASAGDLYLDAAEEGRSPWQEPDERGDDHSVGPVQPGPGLGAAWHSDLVLQDQQFRVLGRG